MKLAALATLFVPGMAFAALGLPPTFLLLPKKDRPIHQPESG